MLAALLLQRRPLSREPWGPKRPIVVYEDTEDRPERESLDQFIERMFRQPEPPVAVLSRAQESFSLLPPSLESQTRVREVLARLAHLRSIAFEDDYLIIMMAVAAAEAEGWL